MKFSRTSLTAMGIALMRALESNRPADERVAYDPFARAFVPGWLWALGRFYQRRGWLERRGPGVMGFLAARERAIDEALVEALRGGARQVVILGAGYDTRAYRLEEMKSVPVFEVDQPATQEAKVLRLGQILPRIPTNVTFVPVDFNTQSLEDRLAASGYDPTLLTVFVWQGVIHYLPLEAIDRTLEFITRSSPPGSTLIFDYADQSYLQSSHGEVNKTNAYGRVSGERLVFGIPDGQLGSFLEPRGFRLQENYRAADLQRLYFTGKRSGQAISPGYAVAVAHVR